MTNTIVLAAGPNGLGVVRSLYLNGIRSHIITRDRDDITHKSKVPTTKTYIEGTTDKEQHQSLLSAILLSPKGTLIIPTSDWFVTFLTEHSQQLEENYKFIIPNAELSEILIDKAKETVVVGNVIPIPKTVQEINNSQQLLDELSLPIIIKPRSHKHMVLGAKNIIIETEKQLQQFFEKFDSVLSSVIAQEIIQGKDSQQWVCNCFFDEKSNITQAFTFNRLRLSPSHYGVTSYAVSEHNQAVIDLSAQLGKALKYTGPAMVEFKQDPVDDIYKYIEINPRLGMCNFFDTSCGINNAFATYQLATQQALPEKQSMKSGVMFVSFYEDLFSRMRDGEAVGTILKEYLSNLATKKHIFIYYVWWDPYPAVSLFYRQIKSFITSKLKAVFNK
jgi:predicted ATP-grasp superfamily ATP-dependent carboligase